MLSLDFLNGPLMKAASSLGKMPPMTPGTGTTASKPMLGGLNKTGMFRAQLPPGTGEGMPPAPPLATSSFDPLANRMPAVKFSEPDRVEDVPIPALPGRTGGPRPYDPQTKAEFEYVMNRQPRDEAGYERKLTFGERFKKSLLPALLGAVEGANSPAGQRNPLGGLIGGAAAGFGGGMLDPTSARQYEWAQMYKPEMDQQEEHQRQVVQDQQKKDDALLDLDERRLGMDYKRQQIEALRAGMKDAGLERDYRQSQIDANKALEQQRLRLKPSYQNVVIDGRPQTIERFPDGTQRILGDSEKAYLQEQGILSKEKIAAGHDETKITTTQMQQEGQTQRTGMQQAGQDRRMPGSPGSATPKAKSGSGSKRQAFIDRAVGAGYSRQEAEVEAKRRGLQ